MERTAGYVIVRKREDMYVCDVTGSFGNGCFDLNAGKTPEDAGLFALAQKAKYIDPNPLGGLMYLPQEVRNAIELLCYRIAESVGLTLLPWEGRYKPEGEGKK